MPAPTVEYNHESHLFTVAFGDETPTRMSVPAWSVSVEHPVFSVRGHLVRLAYASRSLDEAGVARLVILTSNGAADGRDSAAAVPPMVSDEMEVWSADLMLDAAEGTANPVGALRDLFEFVPLPAATLA